MKKLWFGVMATVLFVFNTNSQKMTNESVRVYLAQGMSAFSTSLKPTFNKSVSLEDFKKKTTGVESSKITKEGNDLLSDAYQILTNKTDQDHIVKNYDGKSMAAAALFIDNLSRSGTKSDGMELFGGTTGDYNPIINSSLLKCNWYQIGCWIKEIFGEDSGQLIIDAGLKFIITTILGL